MKKVISVSMVIAMIFIFSACSSAEYTETPVTEIVTDENGETVTDAQGNAVTEVVTDENGNAKTETKKNTTAAKNNKNTTDSKNDSQNNADNNGGNSGNNGGNGNSGNSNNSGSNIGNNNQGGNGSNDNNTPDKDDPTQPTAKPEKPKKRTVTITVNLPYYNGKATKVTMYYKVDGDKEYTAFVPVDIVLDGKGDNKKHEFTIENVKGEIHAYIEFEGIAITHNDVIIPASGDKSKEGTITPVTGIEIMDGGMD